MWLLRLKRHDMCVPGTYVNRRWGQTLCPKPESPTCQVFDFGYLTFLHPFFFPWVWNEENENYRGGFWSSVKLSFVVYMFYLYKVPGYLL